MSSPAEELESLLAFAQCLVQDAGELALARQKEVQGSKKPDRTWVSAADFAVQAFIRERIEAQYPTHQVLAEEEDGSERPALEQVHAALWVLDPIDGTDSYLRQCPTWGVCLGLALEGEPALGLVYLPSSRDLFSATIQGLPRLNGEPITLSNQRRIDRDAMLLIPSKMHLAVEINFPGKVRGYGSTAAHICYVAAGSATAAVSANARPWDLFAAGVILEAAGGGYYTLDGKRLSLNDILRSIHGAPPLVATTAALAPEVFATLKYRQRRR